MVSCICPHAKQDGVSKPNLSKTWTTGPVRHGLSFFPLPASTFTLIPVSLVTPFSFFISSGFKEGGGQIKCFRRKEADNAYSQPFPCVAEPALQGN